TDDGTQTGVSAALADDQESPNRTPAAGTEPSTKAVDGGDGPDGVAAERDRFVDKIRAIRGEIESLRSSLKGSDEEAGGLDQVWLALLRARVEDLGRQYMGMVGQLDDASGRLLSSAVGEMGSEADSESRWFAARGLDIVRLRGDVASLSGSG